MRKNKINRKKLNLFAVYKVTGLNLDNLVNILKNKGVTLYDLKKKDGRTLIVSVNYTDSEKFFAITRDLCYNVKRIGEKGRFRFALKLFRNLGLVIGAVIFTVLSVLFDDVILSVDYYGSGKAVSREINDYLISRGVTEFSRFSDIDLPALSDEILKVSDKISFAECVKCGNRLKINLALSVSPVKTLDCDKESLVSDVDGEIEYVKVYRGTALKRAGDKVKAGEEICGGFAVVKDTEVKVGVIATAAVKAEYFYEYESEKDGDEGLAEIFALIAFGDGEALSTETEKSVSDSGTYIYKIKIVYRRILFT